MTDDIEKERLDRIDMLDGESEDDHKPGTFGYHEALDRTSIIMTGVDDNLLGHPAIMADPEAFRLAHAAFTNLYKLYQHLGLQHLPPK